MNPDTTKKPSKIFAENLREIRAFLGYSQEEVANTLHIARTSYTTFEAGRTFPNAFIIRDIAELFHVSVDMLLRPNCCALLKAAINAPDNQAAQKGDELLFPLVGTYRSLSSFSRGKLLEYAMILLRQEQNGAAWFHQEEVTSHSCTGINEDAVGNGPNYLFVIGGAASLPGKPRMGTDSDTAWLSRETAEALHQRLPDPDRTIPDILRETMAGLRAKWPGDPEEGPSAGAAIVRVVGTDLEAFTLGNCAISLDLADGQIVTLEESRSATLDLTGAGIAYGLTKVQAAENCRSIFLCTDGFARLIGLGAAKTLAGLHRAALREGIDTLRGQLDDFQKSGSSTRRRSKRNRGGNASAILVRVADSGDIASQKFGE